MNSLFILSSVGIIAYYYSSAARTAEERLSNIIIEVKKLASTDLLTQVSNRRHIQEIIDNEISRYERNKKTFSLILCDIDHFKQFNDLHGHECGDFILKKTSTLLISSIRKADYLGRWGGEEFVILLPETDVQGARKVAQKIRVVLEKHSSNYKGKNFNITMTFGVSEFLSGDNFDSCLNRADKAMYSGKKKGRNIVV